MLWHFSYVNTSSVPFTECQTLVSLVCAGKLDVGFLGVSSVAQM